MGTRGEKRSWGKPVFAVAFLLFYGQFGRAQQFGANSADLSKTYTASIFGNPALASSVARVAKAAVRLNLKVAAGAVINFDEPKATALKAGGTEIVLVPTYVSGKGLIPIYRVVQVKVSNSGFQFPEESQLWFCNRPENLTETQTAFRRKLEPGLAVRLLYHHTNKAPHGMFMTVWLRNFGAKNATVALIPGDAEPNKEPVIAGIRVLKSYLPKRATGTGEMLVIPPFSEVPITYRSLVMGEVMSGLCSLENTSPADSDVELLAKSVAPDEISRDLMAASLEPEPWQFFAPRPMSASEMAARDANQPTFPPLIYLNPKEVHPVFLSLKNSTMTSLVGEEGIPQLGGGRHLNGNYGVWYEFPISVSNSSNRVGKLTIKMNAKTNYTGAVFLLNGRLVSLTALQKGEVRTLATIPVGPDSEPKVLFQIVPVSGGSYPVQVSFSFIAGS